MYILLQNIMMQCINKRENNKYTFKILVLDKSVKHGKGSYWYVNVTLTCTSQLVALFTKHERTISCLSVEEDALPRL